MDCVGELEMNKFIVNPANENEIISIEGCRDEIKRLYKELNEAKEIIDKAITFIKTEYNTYPSAKEWRSALIKILEDKEV